MEVWVVGRVLGWEVRVVGWGKRNLTSGGRERRRRWSIMAEDRARGVLSKRVVLAEELGKSTQQQQQKQHLLMSPETTVVFPAAAAAAPPPAAATAMRKGAMEG
jgi:hypothetical protein